MTESALPDTTPDAPTTANEQLLFWPPSQPSNQADAPTTAALKAAWEAAQRDYGALPEAKSTIHSLATHAEGLLAMAHAAAALLARYREERDEARWLAESRGHEMARTTFTLAGAYGERDALAARIDAALALHTRWTNSAIEPGVWYCAICQNDADDGCEPWPCPTRRALEGS